VQEEGVVEEVVGTPRPPLLAVRVEVVEETGAVLS
jgi:hypothetical protein